jgi:hypothetical protein
LLSAQRIDKYKAEQEAIKASRSGSQKTGYISRNAQRQTQKQEDAKLNRPGTNP